MIYPDVPAEVWAKRYNVSIEPKPCAKCGVMKNWIKPFACGDMRGFESDHGSCGEEFRGAIFVSVDKEWNAQINGLFEHMKEEVIE